MINNIGWYKAENSRLEKANKGLLKEVLGLKAEVNKWIYKYGEQEKMIRKLIEMIKRYKDLYYKGNKDVL